MLKKVLVLDNDPDILEVMDEILSYEGFKVATFVGTDDILTLIKQQKPDLLIIDYLLYGLNGGVLCRIIKDSLPTCNLPVILFSAYPKVLQTFDHFGCNAFLSKPFDLSTLINLVTELITAQPTIPVQI